MEEGDHLALSGLTEHGRPRLINDICCESPKAEIKYFCLNVTFVSFAAVEKGICQNPQALAKAGFPLGACGELLPPAITIMACGVLILHLELCFHPFTFTLNRERVQLLRMKGSLWGFVLSVGFSPGYVSSALGSRCNLGIHAQVCSGRNRRSPLTHGPELVT